MAEKGLRVDNALANVKTRRDFRLYLTNISKRPVNLPKTVTVGLAIPYDGPVYEVLLNNLSMHCVGADPVATLSQDQWATSGEAQPMKF